MHYALTGRLIIELVFRRLGAMMIEQARYPLRLRFSGEQINRNGLDLYDGSTSFWGLAQALQIVVHAYMTGEIVTRATALKGAEMYFGGPRRGSVLFDLVTVIEAHPATAALAGAAFYDFVKFSLSKAVGLFATKPETPSVQRKLNVDETFFDLLAETLEGSLQRAHRAIDNGTAQITIERPRSPLVELNALTSQWVNTREFDPAVKEYSGNITRYNSISRNGRAYIRELGKVLPFRPAAEFPDSKRGYLTWSLHGDNVAAKKDLNIWASRVDSAHGEPKRLLLSDCVPR
jgi:hypothetical protein